MIRWFKNIGVFFRKPRGAGTVKTEQTNPSSQRVASNVVNDTEDRRSEGGKGGGGGGHGGGHGGSHGGHGGHGGGHGSRGHSSTSGSSAYQTQSMSKSSGRTGSSASTDRSFSRSYSRGSRSVSTGTTASTISSGTHSRATTSTKSTKSTKSTNTVPSRNTTSSGYSQKSGKSSKSSKYSKSSLGSKSIKKSRRDNYLSSSRQNSVASRRQLRSVSQKSKRSVDTSSSTASTAARSRGRSTGRRNNVNSTASQRQSRSASRSRGRNRSVQRNRSESPVKSTRGQHVSRIDASKKANDVLSPTNRSNQLNRSLSAHHERSYEQRRKTPNGVWNESFPKNTLIIYTDGSYVRRNNCSGIGIFVAPGHELNRSQSIRGRIQNNNYAEFVAVRTALENALQKSEYRNQKVIIRTDCLNVIKALRGEMTTNYSNVKSEVIRLCEQFPKGVDFQHVYAHEGDPGNELADTLAGLATGHVQGTDGGFRRKSSASRERNRRRSKSNDPTMIRIGSHSIQGRENKTI